MEILCSPIVQDYSTFFRCLLLLLLPQTHLANELNATHFAALEVYFDYSLYENNPNHESLQTHLLIWTKWTIGVKTPLVVFIWVFPLGMDFCFQWGYATKTWAVAFVLTYQCFVWPPQLLFWCQLWCWSVVSEVWAKAPWETLWSLVSCCFQKGEKNKTNDKQGMLLRGRKKPAQVKQSLMSMDISIKRLFASVLKA